jgi:3-(3-hydroxy-phenyl)propionate hydroxylase
MNDARIPGDFDSDVAIVGAGPVGTLLAILLANRGKSVTLVERWSTHYGLPRAVTFDHELARVLASIGIDADTDSAINCNGEMYYWRNRDGKNLQIIDWEGEAASGWRVRYFFNQPLLEKRFLGIAAAKPDINVVRGWEGVGLVQDQAGVTLKVRENPEEIGPNGQTREIRAKYVVGADGANSFVREALGIENEDQGYFYDWLILDMIPHFDYCASRPEDPAQWQLCDPKRPTTIVPGGPGPVEGGPDRRRWEFMVLPNEDADDMQKTENAWRLLEPWGLTPQNSELERSAVYRFQARWAKQWNVGRCFLAGDAAHLMPPFAGEGLCAGLRDAFALSWRLNAVLEGKCDETVFNSYMTERLENAQYFIGFSQELGRIICISDEEEAAKRDEMMIAELNARDNKGMVGEIMHIGPGAWCSDSAHAGELSYQGRVSFNGKTDRFDQAVGRGWTLIGLEQDPLQALSETQREQFARLEGISVSIGAPGSGSEVIDVDGVYTKWFAEIEATHVLIRPDFYVAATANSADKLQERFGKVMDLLGLIDASAIAAE